MIVTAGKTNVSVYYYIVQDASGTSPGEPVTGLLFSDIETGGSASYARQGAVRVDLTLITLSGAAATHADGGFILVDDTNMPGLYRCDYPDAAFLTGVDQVFLQIVVASGKNAVAAPILVDINDSVVQTGDSFARIGVAGLGLDDLGGMSDAMKAEINAEVDIALNVTTYAQPGQETPAATTTIRLMIAYLYKMIRNETRQTLTEFSLLNSGATVVDQKRTVSDAAGTATKEELESGP